MRLCQHESQKNHSTSSEHLYTIKFCWTFCQTPVAARVWKRHLFGKFLCPTALGGIWVWAMFGQSTPQCLQCSKSWEQSFNQTSRPRPEDRQVGMERPWGLEGVDGGVFVPLQWSKRVNVLRLLRCLHQTTRSPSSLRSFLKHFITTIWFAVTTEVYWEIERFLIISLGMRYPACRACIELGLSSFIRGISMAYHNL